MAPLLDRGFRADLLTDAERPLEQAVEDGTGGAGFERGMIGGFDLPENLGLAEQHGIQAADDPAKMVGGIHLDLVIEVGRDAGVKALALGEPDFELGHRQLGIGRGEVELGAVAGGNDHALRGLRQERQLGGRLPQPRRAHGEFFPHLYRRGPMIQA